MHVPEINVVKDRFEKLRQLRYIAAWELPYENILTKRSAAIFFFTPTEGAETKKIEDEFSAYRNFRIRANEGGKLSTLKYSITFGEDEVPVKSKIDSSEKEKNL